MANPELTLTGTITEWKKRKKRKSHGFMFAHGEAIVLGKIFIHESRIPTIVKVGQIVEATKLEKYESDDDIDCNYMATAINLIHYSESMNQIKIGVLTL